MAPGNPDATAIDGFNRDKEFDGSHAFPFVRVRINLMDSLRGPAMVLRLIPQTSSPWSS